MKANRIRHAPELPALTGLRFFAAIAIVIHHLRGTFGFPTDVLAQLPLGNGVSFFYVLSGFILTYVYRDIRGASAVGKYMLARAARVWPLHFATFVLICIVIRPPSRIGTNAGPLASALNLSLLHAWVPDYGYFFSFNAVSWSLSVEFFFYLMLPLILLNPFRSLLMSAGGVVALAIVATWIGAGPYTPGDHSPSATSLMYINPVARTFEFVLGVLTAAIWLKSSKEPNGTRTTVLQLAAIGFAATSWIAAPYLSSIPANVAIQTWLYHGGITCFSSALLVYAFATDMGLSPLLSLKPIVYLGRISFALYLVHQIPIHAHNLGIAPFSNIGWPVYLLGVLAAAALLHHVVENPARFFILRDARKLRLTPTHALSEQVDAANACAVKPEHTGIRRLRRRVRSQCWKGGRAV